MKNGTLLTEALNLDLKQSEVDFVIPNLDRDLKLYVDPYLFYQSDNDTHQAVHGLLHEFFTTAIDNVRQGRIATAERMLDFPEVKEIMFGVSRAGHDGRGMGSKRDKLILDEIVANVDIQQKGITHLAEMQLLIEGVGYDLISDMTCNIAKGFFLNYTQEQARLHGIPLERGICLEHVFDWHTLQWDDTHADLPVNPKSGYPILLVPKTVVRRMPIFDFRDFWNTTYRYMLRDIERERSLAAIGKAPKITWQQINDRYGFSKHTVVQVLHDKPELRHTYVDTLEKRRKQYIEPTDLMRVIGADKSKRKAHDYAQEFAAVRPGRADAKKFEKLILRILTRLFSPPLVDPKEQVASHDGREVVDITYYNDAKLGFWNDMKTLWHAQIVVFEVKNMEDLSNEEFFQLSARLDDVRGKFGILVTRKKDSLDIQRAYRRLNKERKVLIVLSDTDLLGMLAELDNGNDPSDILRQMYRAFIDAQ